VTPDTTGAPNLKRQIRYQSSRAHRGAELAAHLPEIQLRPVAWRQHFPMPAHDRADPHGEDTRWEVEALGNPFAWLSKLEPGLVTGVEAGQSQHRKAAESCGVLPAEVRAAVHWGREVYLVLSAMPG